jgi:FixJ family two-component response regulator/tRNA A-37 threonylcarbamoyl transferase component Bud32
MALKILVIDDSEDFRELVRVYLAKGLPDADLEFYDVQRLGRPPENFDWSRYTIVLLDYVLGGDENGLEWLEAFKTQPSFPPTIILTAEGDEYVAVKAVKHGAADYINKKDISPNRLKELIEGALSFNEEKKREQQVFMDEATQIFRNIKDDNLLSDGINTGYRFVRLIGKGGMSEVYLAERVEDELSLVLKIIDLTNIDDKKLIKRFVQEAELIAELNSPFVVKIYEHGMTNNYGYIAMEFFPRGDLKQRMELNLRPEIALNYMIHISYGLDAIHGIGVVHRDLKPANIMFRGDDSLAIADFGISKKMRADISMTTIGQILGTPHYMSPEQGEGMNIDIYSAGVMLYELLAGEKPFIATTPAALIYQHVHAEIPKLPEELARFQEVIDKTLAKDPDDRYQTARDLITVLEQAECELV